MTSAQVPSDEVTVFVVDDEAPVRRALRWLLEAVGFRVETFESAADFLHAYRAGRPGCLLLDLRLPGMDGLELQARLRAVDGLLPVIVVTGYADVPTAVRAMKGGAVEFVEKPVDDRILVEHIRAAAGRHRAALAERRSADGLRARLEALTPREREVLRLVVDGKSSRAIAELLGNRAKTVESHRAAILRKLDAANVADLVRIVRPFLDSL
jgi:FixJ family two-component response regulator